MLNTNKKETELKDNIQNIILMYMLEYGCKIVLCETENSYEIEQIIDKDHSLIIVSLSNYIFHGYYHFNDFFNKGTRIKKEYILDFIDERIENHLKSFNHFIGSIYE